MRERHARKSAPRREQGVAMIMAIGILSLILVLALSFTAASLFSRKLARLSEDLTCARQFCETGLQRIISSFKTELSDYTDYSTFFPGTRNFVKGSGAWADFYYFLSVAQGAARMTDGLEAALSYSVNGLDYFPNTLPGGVDSSWLALFEQGNRGGVDTNLICGRFAYLVVDETGKIDPNTAVDAAAAEGDEPVDGYAMSEIDLTKANITAAFAAKLRPVSAGGKQPTGAKWFSRYHIARILSTSQAELDKVNTTLFPYRRPDEMDSTATYYDISDAATQTPADLVTNIAWFTNWPLKGNYASTTARASQIAANLIDYCDTDYAATTDSTVSPTYFGVEKVPAIARVQVRLLNASYDQGGNSIPVLRVTVLPELINMHGDLSAYTSSAYFTAVVEVKHKNYDFRETTERLTFTRSLTAGAAGVSGKYNVNGYIRATTAVSQESNGVTITGSNGRFGLRDVSAEIISMNVRKSSADDWWDWAVADASSTFDLDALNDYQFAHFKAYNALNNFNKDDWQLAVSLIDRFQAPYTGIGADCPERWTDYPVYVRNDAMKHLVELGAIYRMAPPSGADADKAFRTLNLIDYKYNGDEETPGYYSDAEDGTIDNLDGTLDNDEGNGGDRNLLDMVRLGANNTAVKVMVGRININTRRKNVLEGLFKRIATETYTGGAPIDPAKVDTYIDNLMARTLTQPLPIGLYSRPRNPLLYGLAFQDSETDLPPMHREYLLMMSKELVAAEHNYFTAVIAAQTIKDLGPAPPAEVKVTIGGVPIMVQAGRYDVGADRILAQQRIKAVLYRNAFTNKVTVERFDYIDE